MAISDAAKANFATLLHAAAHGRLVLLECTRKADGATVPVVCAVSDCEDDGDPRPYVLVPLADFTAGYANPYDVFDPPVLAGSEEEAKALEDSGTLVMPD